jgi:hypothetical protein
VTVTQRPDPYDEERRLDGRLPDGVHALGVPTERSGHNAFVLSAAAVVALLALIFTLSWVIFNQLTAASGDQQQQPTQPTQGAPTRTGPLTPSPTLD